MLQLLGGMVKMVGYPMAVGPEENVPIRTKCLRPQQRDLQAPCQVVTP